MCATGLPEIRVERTNATPLEWETGFMRGTSFVFGTSEVKDLRFPPVAWFATVRALKGMEWEVAKEPRGSE